MIKSIYKFIKKHDFYLFMFFMMEFAITMSLIVNTNIVSILCFIGGQVAGICILYVGIKTDNRNGKSKLKGE